MAVSRRSVAYTHVLLTALAGICAIGGLLLPSRAMAAIITWDGGGADTNWNTCANWSGNTCPGASDIATFDTTSTKDALINTSISVAGIAISSGYTGTITQASGMTVTVGTSNYSQADGVFAGGNSSITMNGTFALSGGTFTSTSGTMTIANTFTKSGGTFNHNSGTGAFNAPGKTITTGGATFYNVQFGSFCGGTMTLADDWDINGNLTTNACNTAQLFAPSGTRTINLAGNFLNIGGNLGNSSTLTLRLDGTGTQTLVQSNGTFSAGLTIAKASGTVVLNSNFTVTSGTIAINTANTLDTSPNGGSTNYNFTTTGVFTNSGTFLGRTGSHTFSHTFTNGGTFSVTGTTLVTFSPIASRTITTGGATFNNVQFGSICGATMTLADDWDINGNLTTTACNSAQQFSPSGTRTINLAGNFTNSNGNLGNSSTLTLRLDGTGTQTLTQTSGAFSANLTVAKPSGTVVLGSNFSATVGTIAINVANILDTSPNGGTTNYNFTTTGVFTNTGTFLGRAGSHSFSNTFANAGTFSASGTTLVTFSLTGINRTITTGGATFNNVQFGGNCGGTMAFADDWDINGNLSISACNTSQLIIPLGTRTINLAGNFITSSGNLGNASTLTLRLDGTGTQTLTPNGGVLSSALTIAKPSGTAVLANNLTVTLKATTISTGILYLNGFNLTSATGFSVSSGGTFKLRGSETYTTPTLNAGSTVYLNTSTATTIPNLTFHSLTLSGAVFTLSSTKTLGGNLIITGSTLNTTTLVVADNIVVTGSTSNKGTVRYQGTSTYSSLGAGSSYYNLAFSGAGTWSLASHTTASGALTFTGGTLNTNGKILTVHGVTRINRGSFQASTGGHTFSGGLVMNGGSLVGSTGTLDINGSVQILTGSLVAPSTTMTVAGNWNKTGGTFTHNSGTVQFDGTNQTLSGSHIFYNLTKTTSSADTFKFAWNATQSVSGALTLRGAASNILTLRSTKAGTKASIILDADTGTQTLDYLTVMDNTASGARLYCLTGCTNGGNTTNWQFSLPTLSFQSGSLTLSETSGTASLLITLSGSSLQTITLPFLITGTATPASDFLTLTPSPLTLTSGETSTGILLSFLNDTDIESNETIILTLDTPTNASLGALTTLTLTLTSDEPISSSAGSQGGSGGGGGGGGGRRGSTESIQEKITAAFTSILARFTAIKTDSERLAQEEELRMQQLAQERAEAAALRAEAEREQRIQEHQATLARLEAERTSLQQQYAQRREQRLHLALERTEQQLRTEQSALEAQQQALAQEQEANRLRRQQRLAQSHSSSSYPSSSVSSRTSTVARNRNRLFVMVGAVPMLFKDVETTAWYAPYVADLITSGVAQGYKTPEGALTGEFGVSNPVTKAELLKMALEAANHTLQGGTPRNASAKNTWAAPYSAEAELLQLTVFSPSVDVHTPATRGEVIQTILEVMKFPIAKQAALYNDVPNTHPYAHAIATAAFHGLIQGDTTPAGTPLNRFRPNDPINRAEVAKIIALIKEVVR